jgi:hypothetical protein
MRQVSFRIAATALMVVVFAAPAFALGGAQVPPRNANVWNWRAHQPTETETQQKETMAGVVASRSQSDAASVTVNQLYRQLLGSPD